MKPWHWTVVGFVVVSWALMAYLMWRSNIDNDPVWSEPDEPFDFDAAVRRLLDEEAR